MANSYILFVLEPVSKYSIFKNIIFDKISDWLINEFSNYSVNMENRKDQNDFPSPYSSASINVKTGSPDPADFAKTRRLLPRLWHTAQCLLAYRTDAAAICQGRTNNVVNCQHSPSCFLCELPQVCDPFPSYQCCLISAYTVHTAILLKSSGK
jgi:hypothetical protein